MEESRRINEQIIPDLVEEQQNYEGMSLLLLC